MITSLLPKHSETPIPECIGGTAGGTSMPPQLHKIEPSWNCVCSCSTAHSIEHLEGVTTRLRQELAGIHGGAGVRRGLGTTSPTPT